MKTCLLDTPISSLLVRVSRLDEKKFNSYLLAVSGVLRGIFVVYYWTRKVSRFEQGVSRVEKRAA